MVLDYHQKCNPIAKVRNSLVGDVIKCYTPDTCSNKMGKYKCMYLVNDQVYKKLIRSNEECTKNALAGVNSNTNSININNENYGNSKSPPQEVPVSGSSDKPDNDSSQPDKFLSPIEKQNEPMEIGDEEDVQISRSFPSFLDSTTLEKAVPVNSQIQTDKPQFKNSGTQHEATATSSIGVNTLKNNKTKKIQTQKTSNKDGESQTSEKVVKDSGVQTQEINSNKKKFLPSVKSEIKFSPKEKKKKISDKIPHITPIPPKKPIPAPRTILPSKFVKSSDKAPTQPVNSPSLWEKPLEASVNFPPKKHLNDSLLNKPNLKKSLPSFPIKRKSFFPDSKNKKIKSEIAGKRKSEARSSRFPEKIPKRLKSVKSRITVLNPEQINKRWVDSDSE